MAVAAAIGVEGCEEGYSRSKFLNRKMKKQAMKRINNEVIIHFIKYVHYMQCYPSLVL
jgi:hypothetical protein